MYNKTYQNAQPQNNIFIQTLFKMLLKLFGNFNDKVWIFQFVAKSSRYNAVHDIYDFNHLNKCQTRLADMYLF